MTVNIGIFDKEESVLNAVRLMREAGAEEEDIRVIVNNREGAPQLASREDIRMEELYEIQESRNRDADGNRSEMLIPGVIGYPAGMSTIGPVPAAIVISGNSVFEGPDSAEILGEMGIPGHAAKRCAEAIESGRYVLVADTDPDISSESLLDHAGAAEIVS